MEVPPIFLDGFSINHPAIGVPPFQETTIKVVTMVIMSVCFTLNLVYFGSLFAFPQAAAASELLLARRFLAHLVVQCTHILFNHIQPKQS